MDTRNACRLMKRADSKRRARRKESVKVVYISTPMKVTTSVSKFKSLVQHLTGRHSDIYRIMETNGTTDFETFPDNHLYDDVPDEHFHSRRPHSLLLSLTDSCLESSPTSESLTDHAFSTQVDDEQLQEMFPIDLFLDLNSSDLEVDVLCSSHAL